MRFRLGWNCSRALGTNLWVGGDTCLCMVGQCCVDDRHAAGQTQGQHVALGGQVFAQRCTQRHSLRCDVMCHHYTVAIQVLFGLS
jgi:hypothetical protein